MKYLIIIIKANKKEAILATLAELGVSRLIISEVRGYGGEAHEEHFRGGRFTTTDAPRLKIETAVNDPYVEKVITAVNKVGNEQKGSGKIFVLPLEDCIRASTGHRGEKAINH